MAATFSSTVDQRTLSKILGISARTIDRLEADGIVVPTKHGRGGRATEYDLTVVVPAYIEHRSGAKKTTDLHVEKTRIARAQAEKAEMELQVRRGELYPRARFRDELTSLIKALMARLEGLPRRLVQLGILAPTQELEATLVIRELREEIARWKTQEDTDAASA